MAPIRDHLDGPFALEEDEPGTEIEIGRARLRVAPLRHPGVSHAIRVEAGGKVLCFSGDTGLTPALAEHARGADILLCEATYGDVTESDGVHLSAFDEAPRPPRRAPAGCCWCIRRGQVRRTRRRRPGRRSPAGRGGRHPVCERRRE